MTKANVWRVALRKSIGSEVRSLDSRKILAVTQVIHHGE